MKILGISGSPRVGGNTDAMVKMVLEGARSAGSETTFLQLKRLEFKGCQACMYCRENDTCALNDDMTKIYSEIESADALVIGSPVYMFQMTAKAKAFMDRLFPYHNSDHSSKVSKPTVLVFSQDTPNAEAFKPYFEHTAKAYSFLGFPVLDTIVAAAAVTKAEVTRRDELRARLHSVGERLCDKASGNDANRPN